MAYSNTKRLPGFHDQFMLLPDQRTFNWPFLQAREGRRHTIYMSII